MKPASRTDLLGVEGAFDVLSRARALEAQGRSIIHLEIGEPDFPTPAHIIEAGKQALDQGFTHYGPTMGLPEFRQAIARDIQKTRNIPADPAQICVTPGAKPALFYAMAAALNPGDEVLLPDPGFPIYASLARYLGAVPVGVDFGDLDSVRSHWNSKTRMVILNSPENPTGRVLTASALETLASWTLNSEAVVISDEIYRTIYFGDRPPDSISSLPGMASRTIVIDGFSKSHAMTGWRLGYGFFPNYLVDAVSKLMVNSNSCTASFVQRAGIAALEGPQEPCLEMVAEFRRRRDVFVRCLTSIQSFRSKAPLGAFYAFPDIRGTGWDAKALADHLLNVAGVACLSGTAFGPKGVGHLRFSLANSMENLQLAAERIASCLQG